jgi:voltage-gated potassium channel
VAGYADTMDPSGSPRADSPEREGLARRLDRPMGVLGLVFVLVVLGQSLAREAWLVATHRNRSGAELSG